MLNANIEKSLLTRRYADYYFRCAQRWRVFDWATQSVQCALLITSGIIGILPVSYTSPVATLVASSITVLMGVAILFIGKVKVSSLIATNEKAGNNFAILSMRYGKAESSNNDYIVLDAQFEQYIFDYDEPPASVVRLAPA
jgi:hypothetical protein